jgi:sulfatase maturation enzyme AslB (radical SAM superfamily)
MCNANCDYCFVFHPVGHPRRRPGRMSAETAKTTAIRIAEHVRAHRLERVEIVFHGGEPLLVGPRHFERLVSVFDGILSPIASVRFAVQTNGTLITEAWVDLFSRCQVSVGVSLDGPPLANDRHRLSREGESTAVATERGIALLSTCSDIFNGLLAVVDLANDPIETYQYLVTFRPPVIDFNLPHASHQRPPVRNMQCESSTRMHRVWV